MQFGFCVYHDELSKRAVYGTDYVELRADRLADASEEEFRAFRRDVEAGLYQTYSCNGLIHRRFRMTGEDADLPGIKEYCKFSFDRLAQLGVKVLVFGSGPAKHVPEGFPFERAWEQLAELGNDMADVAAQYGQTVVVEPLSFNEVNIVNTLDDGAKYCRLVGRDNFKLLCDFYHFTHNGEDWAELGRNADLLYHVHIASRPRKFAKNKADWQFFRECLLALRAIGYDRNVTFEGGRLTPAKTRIFGARMHEIWDDLQVGK